MYDYPITGIVHKSINLRIKCYTSSVEHVYFSKIQYTSASSSGACAL